MTDASANGATEIKIQDLATLVAGMSRLLTRLGGMPAFQEAGMGLAEWSALSFISGKSGINYKQLANALGVSAQRVNQIADLLRDGGNIAVNTSADDARKKIIMITPSGSQRLSELNAKLLPIVTAGLNKRPKVIGRASSMIDRILKHVAGPAKAKGKQATKNRRKRGARREFDQSKMAHVQAK
jgi:DNA-binding MarR family transcriptional regulator